jgi:hypothetical protein
VEKSFPESSSGSEGSILEEESTSDGGQPGENSGTEPSQEEFSEGAWSCAVDVAACPSFLKLPNCFSMP